MGAPQTPAPKPEASPDASPEASPAEGPAASPNEVGPTDVPGIDLDATEPPPDAPTEDAPGEPPPSKPEAEPPPPKPEAEPPPPKPEVEPPPPPKPVAPPPVLPRRDAVTVRVAVGMSPDAPGTKQERGLLDALERSARASRSPSSTVRRIPLGSGHVRRICRERRDDLVILIGYVPSRPAPTVLAHDCRLDTPLAVRSAAAAAEPGLVGALWREHEALVRSGMRERRAAAKLSPRARGGIIAGVAIAAVGGAIAILLASALRKEQVVLTVRP